MSPTAHTNNFGLFQSPNPRAGPSAGTAVSDMLHVLDQPLNARNPGQLTDRVVARGEELNPPVPGSSQYSHIRDIVFKGVRSPPPFDPTGVSSQSFAASTPWNDILNWILGQGVPYTSDRYLYTILPEDVHRDIALLLFNTSADKGQMPHRLTPAPGSSHVTLGQFFMYHAFGPLDMEHFGHFLNKSQALIGRLEVRLQINMNEEELEKAMVAAASAGPSAVPRSPVKSSRRGTKRRADAESDEIHVRDDEDDDEDSNTLAQIICLEQEGNTPFDVCVSREPIMIGTRLNTYRLKNDSTRVDFEAKRFSNFGCRPPVTVETNYEELCNEMTCREMFQQTVSSFFRELGGCSLYSSTFELAPFMLYKVTEGKDCGLSWIVDPVLKKDPTRIGLLLCALEPNRGVSNLAVQTFAALAHYSLVISSKAWVIAAAQGCSHFFAVPESTTKVEQALSGLPQCIPATTSVPFSSFRAFDD
ncbi:hypothetical protein EXIGLDRAFT_757436 [Exidia glandulosa HHB12029]|uniref:Uncharacterized protein n=1 Tax=Exidia glandulosa HHB12029 TaxID=1314781 RepID=A0A166N569_EXIGL|nr:hypothetical protein EXIGLDRAFT_757436 [Exidia glandulosa HHB12029]